MGRTTKLIPVILFGVSLGGCSMAGTGDYFADDYALMQQQQLPQHYGVANSCAPSPCAPYAGQVSTPYVGYASTPDAHAYGQSVQGHSAYHGPQQYVAPAYAYSGAHAAHKGLRPAYTYGELGAIAYDVDSELFGGLARVGYQSKSIFGAEVEGTLGFTDDSATVLTAAGPLTGEIQVKNSIAGFGLARVPVSPRFNVLGRVGYHNTELDADITDAAGVVTDADFSTDGLVYGVGAEYALSPRTSVRADYTIYDYDGPDADSLSLAISRKF